MYIVHVWEACCTCLCLCVYDQQSWQGVLQQRCTCSVVIKSTVPLPWQYTSPEQVTEQAPSGCYVSGLYLEGARWDLKNNCLQRSHPKVLIEELPILRIIPIEAHRLKLVVRELM